MPVGYVMSFALGTIVALLLLLRLGERVFSPAHDVAREIKNTNTARRLLSVGEVLAVFLVAVSAVRNCLRDQSLVSDVIWVGAFAISGLLIVVFTGRLGCSVLLRSRLRAEVERGNLAAGLAAGAHYVATGIITSRALSGHSLKELGLSLGFFALAQLTLHLFVVLFRALTTYDDAEQIEGENLAAALSYSGVTVAIAMVIARALDGEFEGWLVSLRGYAAVLGFLFAFYPMRQLLIQTVLLGGRPSLRGGALDQGIAGERNEGMAALEAGTYLSTALAISQLL